MNIHEHIKTEMPDSVHFRISSRISEVWEPPFGSPEMPPPQPPLPRRGRRRSPTSPRAKMSPRAKTRPALGHGWWMDDMDSFHDVVLILIF